MNGSSSGAMTLKAPAVASTYVMTFPAATDTVDVLGTAQSITALKTFSASDIAMVGTSAGVTTFATANSSASNYTITFPAATGTVALTSGTFANPMTTLGDIIYGGASGVATRLAGNTTTTPEFYTSTGAASAAN